MIFDTTRFQSLETNATSATTSTAIPSSVATVMTGAVGHFVAVGTNPTVSTSSFYIPANSIVELAMTNSTSTKIALLSSSGISKANIAY